MYLASTGQICGRFFQMIYISSPIGICLYSSGPGLHFSCCCFMRFFNIFSPPPHPLIQTKKHKSTEAFKTTVHILWWQYLWSMSLESSYQHHANATHTNWPDIKQHYRGLVLHARISGRRDSECKFNNSRTPGFKTYCRWRRFFKRGPTLYSSGNTEYIISEQTTNSCLWWVWLPYKGQDNF